MIDTYSFFVNGYAHGHIDEISNYNYSQYKFADCYDYDEKSGVVDQNALGFLKDIFLILENKFIQPLFNDYELIEMSMWEGVDSLSRTWHNDYIKGKSFNTNILVYLDEGNIDNGNFIEVRNGVEEFRIYPKVGDFVWLNQKHQFQHKATHTSGVRRVISYELMIKDLL